MATQPDYPLLTAKAFLEIDFGEKKAELDNGVIRMMAGGTVRHAQVQGNIFGWLRQQLRCTGCRPSGSEMATATATHHFSIRYPDVSVYCGSREAVRVVQRTGPNGWAEQRFDEPTDVPLPSLDLVIPHDEIFARD
jgi:Uma2 family endonuclease